MEDEEIEKATDPLHSTAQVGRRKLKIFKVASTRSCNWMFHVSRVMSKSQKGGNRVRKDAYANTVTIRSVLVLFGLRNKKIKKISLFQRNCVDFVFKGTQG